GERQDAVFERDTAGVRQGDGAVVDGLLDEAVKLPAGDHAGPAWEDRVRRTAEQAALQFSAEQLATNDLLYVDQQRFVVDRGAARTHLYTPKQPPRRAIALYCAARRISSPTGSNSNSIVNSTVSSGSVGSSIPGIICSSMSNTYSPLGSIIPEPSHGTGTS